MQERKTLTKPYLAWAPHMLPNLPVQRRQITTSWAWRPMSVIKRWYNLGGPALPASSCAPLSGFPTYRRGCSPRFHHALDLLTTIAV